MMSWNPVQPIILAKVSAVSSHTVKRKIREAEEIEKEVEGAVEASRRMLLQKILLRIPVKLTGTSTKE